MRESLTSCTCTRPRQVSTVLRTSPYRQIEGERDEMCGEPWLRPTNQPDGNGCVASITVGMGLPSVWCNTCYKAWHEKQYVQAETTLWYVFKRSGLLHETANALQYSMCDELERCVNICLCVVWLAVLMHSSQLLHRYGICDVIG